MKVESTKSIFGSHYGIVIFEEVSGDIVNPTVIAFESIASMSGFKSPQGSYKMSINTGDQVITFAVSEVEDKSLPNSWDGIYSLIAEVTAWANNTDTDPS
jgi:hypothetical protein